jgi:hypothetical protein
VTIVTEPFPVFSRDYTNDDNDDDDFIIFHLCGKKSMVSMEIFNEFIHTSWCIVCAVDLLFHTYLLHHMFGVAVVFLLCVASQQFFCALIRMMIMTVVYIHC